MSENNIGLNSATIDYLQKGIAYIAKSVERIEKSALSSSQPNKRLDVECAQINSRNTF